MTQATNNVQRESLAFAGEVAHALGCPVPSRGVARLGAALANAQTPLEVAIARQPMRPCLECRTLTRGSVGAAGLRWPALCQECKDRADGCLSYRIKAAGSVAKALMAGIESHAAPAADPEHPVCSKCGGLASHDNSGWHCCGKQIEDPEPVDHRAEFLADFHAKADMVLPVRDGIPTHADQDVDLRAVLDEQAADLRRTRLKCDCCPDCGEPLTEFEQAFDALGHEIHGKQTRECSDACGWDGEERNTPARAWR